MATAENLQFGTLAKLPPRAVPNSRKTEVKRETSPPNKCKHKNQPNRERREKEKLQKCYKSKNGISLYTYENPALHGFYLSLFLRAGSMYEGEGERGITHFLEHALVRNVNKRRNLKLYSELDSRGVEFNASTYAEMVQFYTSGANKSFSFGADILTEIISEIVLSPAEIDAERRRIKAEIRESDDKGSLSTLSSEEVFSGTTLAGSIMGTSRTVDRITKSRLEAYRRRVFTPENIFFYLTGSFSEEDIEYLLLRIDELSLDSPAMAKINDNCAPVPQNFGNRGANIVTKSADYTMVRFTFDVDMSKVPSQILDLIYDYLLGGYSSPFFIEMSEERGLFYDISGATERYRNIGVLYFTYEVKEKNLCDAVKMSVEILRNFKNRQLSESECMKCGYVDNAYLLYDDAREFNFTFAYDNLIMGLGYTSLEDRIAAYKSITAENIRAAAECIFRPENLTLAIKGNKKRIDVKKLTEIIKEL